MIGPSLIFIKLNSFEREHVYKLNPWQKTHIYDKNPANKIPAVKIPDDNIPGDKNPKLQNSDKNPTFLFINFLNYQNKLFNTI